ncbi:Rv1733c family protein [Streptomyces aidingensis]|uniref:Transmembrane protein n=1 Tax=Streptomyces aidingensis TaxID=910347 RepID=A0A1I1JD51_9ACTN|nr:hypothetical protein [Streptomyces aidingensis]SFC43360.1 hypothetical protein SAMN05421773_103284 [Streptomyces aidingensis]
MSARNAGNAGNAGPAENGTPRVRRRTFWRWRRNPLRRRSDLLEAWLRLGLTVSLVLGVAVSGALTGLAVHQDLTALRYERHQVTAEVQPGPEQQDDAGDSGTDGGADRPDTGDAPRTDGIAVIEWTAPEGGTRSQETLVPADAAAGSEITVWTDDSGRLVEEPPTPTETAVQALIAAAFVAGCWALAVLLARHAALAALNRRRELEWEFEWASVGSHWQTGPSGPER